MSIRIAGLSKAQGNAAYQPYRPQAYGDAAGMANGTPAALTTGQAVTVFGNAPITVTSGKYVHTPFAGVNSAGYMQLDNGADVAHIGATMLVPTGSISRPTFVLPLAAWANGSLTPAGLHLVLNPVTGDWTCSYWDGSATNVYASGNVGPFLDVAADCDVYVDKANGKATLYLPNGGTAKVASPRLTDTTGHYAVWELYETDGTGATTGAFTNVRADGLVTIDNRPWRDDIAKAAPPTAAAASGTSSGDILIPTSMTTIHASLSVTFTAPRSGKVAIRCTGNINTAAQKVNWQVYGGVGAPAAVVHTVANQAWVGACHAEWQVTGLTPGTAYTYVWQHSGSVASAGNFKSGDASGYPATMVVAPIGG